MQLVCEIALLPRRGADRSVLTIVVIRSRVLFIVSGYAQLMWNIPQSQSPDCDTVHSERDSPPAVAAEHLVPLAAMGAALSDPMGWSHRIAGLVPRHG